jgi:hypothetical protein
MCKDASTQVDRVVSCDLSFREALSKEMREIARQKGLDVDTRELIVASHESVTAAHVPITTEASSDDNTLLSLVFFSHPSYSCAETLPTGFYTAEFSARTEHSYKDTVGTVIYRNLDGEIILRNELRAADIPHQVPSVGVKLVVSKGSPTQGVDILQLWRVKPPGAHHTLDLVNKTCLPPGG